MIVLSLVPLSCSFTLSLSLSRSSFFLLSLFLSVLSLPCYSNYRTRIMYLHFHSSRSSKYNSNHDPSLPYFLFSLFFSLFLCVFLFLSHLYFPRFSLFLFFHCDHDHSPLNLYLQHFPDAMTLPFLHAFRSLSFSSSLSLSLALCFTIDRLTISSSFFIQRDVSLL